MYEVNTMLGFITNYGGSIAVGAVVLTIIVLIVVKGVKDRRAGKSSCGCDCGSCSCGCGCGAKRGKNNNDD